MIESRYIHLYALAVLEYADEHGLSDVYQQIWNFTRSGKVALENIEPQALISILEDAPPEDVESILMRFLELARGKLETMPVEIISAVPLTQEQLYNVQVKLILMLRKKLSIIATVDSTLLGGIRILIGSAVVDHSVKRMLADMREAIYEGVYQVNE